MTAVMNLCPDVEFPTSTVTEPIGIFGQRGYGKSWSAVDLVEELYRAGLPSVVIDVKGDWWGIRSSADGKRDGLPFLIFGGDHADVPLEPGSARAIARFVAERNVPCIIDVSHLSKTKARQWVMEFAEELYDLKRRLRSPLMLVVDEADVLIPQRLAADLMRLLGAMEDIAKRGRQRGLGICVATQRVADVNKSVTDLLTTLIIHNVSGSRTRKALMEWVDDHARDAGEVEAVLSSLSTLEPGEVWVWSPAFLRLLRRTRMRPITTYDSHATPEPGETIEMPGRMADIPIEQLSAELAASIERAKADDPAALKRRVAELERKLQAADNETTEILLPLVTWLVDNEPDLYAGNHCIDVAIKLLTEWRDKPAKPVEVPVLTPEQVHLIESMWQAVLQAGSVMTEHATKVHAAMEEAIARIDASRAVARAEEIRRAEPRRIGPAAAKVPSTPSRRAKATSTQSPPARPATVLKRTSPTSAGSTDDVELSDTELLLLQTLVQRYPIPMSVRDLAIRSRRSHTSSTTKTAVSRLRALGLATGGKTSLVATDAGIERAGGVDPMPTGADLWEWWKERLSQAEWDLLTAVGHVYPDGLTDGDATESAGYSRTSSTPKTALGKLRALGLVVKFDGLNTVNDELGEARA